MTVWLATSSEAAICTPCSLFRAFLPSYYKPRTFLIAIQVIGELSADCHRFLTITRQLCVSDHNEVLPDIPEQPTVHPGKLYGSHSWPFSIRLPRGVCIIPGDGFRHTFRLPPSMDGKAQIRYHLLVRVKRGSLSAGQR